MPTSNDFSEYYKTISNTELLSILENPNDYQPFAIEAAKKEFVSRQLPDTEIQNARQILAANQAQREVKREKIKVVETKIKAAGETLIETINPIQPGIPSTEKTIRLIVIAFALIFLYQFFSDFRTHLAYLRNFPRSPLESGLYLFPLVLLPVATITFWRRKTLGWTLLTIFITFSAAGIMWVLFQALTWKPSGFAVLDNLFQRPSPTSYIIQLLFCIGFLYVLCKANIREVFFVGQQRMGATIAITAVVTFFLMLA